MGLFGARSVSRDPKQLLPEGGWRDRPVCHRPGLHSAPGSGLPDAGQASPAKLQLSTRIPDVNAYSRGATGHAGLRAVCHYRPAYIC